MANIAQAKIITSEEVNAVRQPLSRGLLDAAGILKNKRIDALKYQRAIRREWEKRLKRVISK